MDPDRALAEIRKNIQLFRDLKERGEPWEKTVPVAELIVDQVQDLDEWLSHSGFPPEDWEQ